jgi:carbon-monoxide dehydrogenase medium subunit
MIRQPFDYHAPDTLAAAVAIMAQHGDDASVLGGGTMLVPRMTAGAVQPKAVLDLRHLPLDTVRREDGRTIVGALTSYHTLRTSPVIATHVSLLKLLADGITGGPQILHQGTIGGSACFANPASDVPACLLAVDAAMIAVSVSGSRAIAAQDFFMNSFRNALAANEFLTEIVVPDSKAAQHGYEKFKFCTSSWPIVTAACDIAPCASGAGVARVGIGGAWPVPRCIELSIDPVPNAGDIADAVRIAANGGDYWADELAPADYRQAITPAIVAKAIRQALANV